MLIKVTVPGKKTKENESQRNRHRRMVKMKREIIFVITVVRLDIGLMLFLKWFTPFTPSDWLRLWLAAKDVGLDTSSDF